MLNARHLKSHEPCPICGKPATPTHWHCSNCGEEAGYQGHMIDGRFACRRKPYAPRFQLQGLGDAADDAIRRVIFDQTQLAIGRWSVDADQVAQSILPTINAATENVRRGGDNVTIGDLQKLWANKTLAEKVKYELTQRVMAATGKAPYQMSAQNQGEALFLQAQKSLTAASNLADVGLSSYGQKGNDPDSAFFAEANSRYESLLQSWANAATSAASAVQGAGETLKAAGSATKTAIDAAKEAADALKKLAPERPFSVAAFLGGGAVVAVVAVGVLAWLFGGRK